MEKFETKTIVKKNHKIELENVPFDNGEEVEIEITSKANESKKNYKLRGTLLKYDEPFKPIAEDSV